MYLVSRVTNVEAKPAVPVGEGAGGWFTRGDPGTGTPATQPGYEWYNRVQGELAAAIQAAGLALDPNDDTQLAQAIVILANTQADDSYIRVTDDGVNPGFVVMVVDGTEALRALPNGEVQVNGPAFHPPVALIDQATIAWDVRAAPDANVTLAGDRAMAAPTNVRDGTRYGLEVRQDATGNRLITAWDAKFVFTDDTPPDGSTGANQIDHYVFKGDAAGNLRCVGFKANA